MSRERNLSFTIGNLTASAESIQTIRSDNIMEKDKPEMPALSLAQQQAAVMSPILQYNRLLTFQNHLNHLALSLTVPPVPSIQPYRRKISEEIKSVLISSIKCHNGTQCGRSHDEKVARSDSRQNRQIRSSHDLTTRNISAQM